MESGQFPFKSRDGPWPQKQSWVIRVGDCVKTIVLVVVVVTACHTDSHTASSRSSLTSFINTDETIPSESELDHAVLRLKAGAAILIGSLDQTARQHEVKLLWHPDDAHQESSQQVVATNCSVVSFPKHWTPPVEMPLPSLSSMQDSTHGARSKRRAQEDAGQVIVQLTASECRTRRFVVPFFCGQLIHDRHVLATEIARGDQVSVYLVNGDDDAFDQQSVEAIDLAAEIVQRTEGRVLEFVHSQLGAITDLDEDGRLTFVLGRLSNHSSDDSSQQPITGCVRPDDFLSGWNSATGLQSGGDIVYLDCKLPRGEELDAVLAHELAHAATFCAVRESRHGNRRPLPGWLNEAIAHYIELQVNPESANLRGRLIEFTRAPNRFPLVIPDSVRQMSLRRGPARAAACLFLNSALSDMPPETLRRLVRLPATGPGRLEAGTGKSFDEILRDWGLNLIASDRSFPTQNLEGGDPLEFYLAGTAFTWTSPVKTSGTLEIHAARDCLMQLTVVAKDVSRIAGVDDAVLR